VTVRGSAPAPDRTLSQADCLTREPIRYRRIAHLAARGEATAGFAGEGHTTVQVFGPETLVSSDPFVLLMDDTLDLNPRPTGGAAHPHAGLETVTLILEGSIQDADEGLLQAGDLTWMTAGRGVIHNETCQGNWPHQDLTALGSSAGPRAARLQTSNWSR